MVVVVIATVVISVKSDVDRRTAVISAIVITRIARPVITAVISVITPSRAAREQQRKS
jgi:hypothetical protein